MHSLFDSMVSRSNKNQAVQYICDRLEDSGLYVVQRKEDTNILIRERPPVRPTPRGINIVVANFVQPVKAFKRMCHSNEARDIYTAAVLYKDGKTAFVRMVDRNPSWRTEKSLKNYSAEQINHMLHLRGIEKAVLGEFGRTLRYYQPETERLPEGLRKFRLDPVELDYSHIEPGDPSYEFVENRESIDYKLPEEIPWDKPAAGILFSSDSWRKVCWLEPAERAPAVQENLF